MDIQVTRWSERAFAEGRSAWNRLLRDSQADPLFLGWEWQYSWWSVFGRRLGESLNLYAAYSGGELVGLAPLYMRRSRLRGVWPLRRLQFIGNCWQDVGTMRSEHLEFIVREAVARPVTAALLRHLRQEVGYDELVLSDIRQASETFIAANAPNRGELGYLRTSAPSSSYYIETSATFDRYLASLGKGHQKRVFKQRSRLTATGQVSVRAAPPSETVRHLELLDRLHARRWGSALFNAPRWAFNRMLISRLQQNDAVELSVLSLDEHPVSMLYLLTAGGRQYYLQGGFDEQFGRRVSLNLLHLGYLIERAFADTHIERFYLLAGGGKNTDYKQHLASGAVGITDLQFVRAPALRLAYYVYDRLAANDAKSGTAGAPPQATTEKVEQPT